MKPTSNRSKLIPSLSVLASVLLAIAVSRPVEAHDINVVLTGLGTATIDGIISSGEWDNAGSINFPANVPALEGGGTTPATLFVMNDQNNLYLAVRIQRPSLDLGGNIGFRFDNNHDGLSIQPGDDVVVLNQAAQLFDDFRSPCPGAPPTSAGCIFLDVSFGGTDDGIGAVSNDGTFTVYEQSRPLDSADDAHDFSLSLGDTVGFRLEVRLVVGPFSEGGFADTGFPHPCRDCPSLYGDIVITSPFVPVEIDIKPGSEPNCFNINGHGVIPVAILGSADLNVSDINVQSLLFDGLELRVRGNKGPFCSIEDSNADAFPDLVYQFEDDPTNWSGGGATASVTGELDDGTPIQGTDSICIVP